MSYGRCVVIAALALVVGGSSAVADVGIRAVPSAARAHARAIAVASPGAVAPGDVLVAVMAARASDHARLGGPSGWRLTGRTNSGSGRRAVAQALFVHVARKGDAHRLVFRSNERTALSVRVLALRGVDARKPISGVASSPTTSDGLLDAPALASAVPGDLLVVEYASLGGAGSSGETGHAAARSSDIVVTIVTQQVRKDEEKAHAIQSHRGPALAFVVHRRRHSPSGTTGDPGTPADPSPPPPGSPPTPPKPPATPPAPPAPPAGALVSDSFSVADGLLTNEYAYYDLADPASRQSSTWQLDSGSLFAKGGAGWTGVPDDVEPNAASSNGNDSAIFRLVTKRADLGNVSVSFRLLNSGLTQTGSTPAVDWDGVHVFLRYQSEFSLYYASINRRDGTAVIKKKVPGGPDNGGTYYELTSYVSHPVPYGSWQSVTATVQTNGDGSVTIRLLSGGALVAAATDTGVGGPPITNPGRVGLRGDNCNFQFDDFEVTPLG